MIGLSSIFWRESWKYGERAFRYCNHDVGHALACLRFAANLVGWKMVYLNALSHEEVETLLGLTIGSMGAEGRGFLTDLAQADGAMLRSAFIGGVVFNIANLLVVAAIDVAGLAVAFPVAIGLAPVIGVVVNYVQTPLGDPLLLFGGVVLVAAAILVDARAYSKLPSAKGATARGLVLSVLAGVLMGFFYRFVAASMVSMALPSKRLLTKAKSMRCSAKQRWMSSCNAARPSS